MQPITPQDRPKLIAVLVALVLAVGFLARNLMGSRALAQPQDLSTSVPNIPASVAPDDSGNTSLSGNESGAATAPASARDAWVNAPVQIPTRDPYRPLEGLSSRTTTVVAAAQPPAVLLAPPARSWRLRRALGASGALLAPPARSWHSSSASATSQERECNEPRARPQGALSASAASQERERSEPGDALASAAQAAPSVPVTLAGTVESGQTSVATFHVDKLTVLARPGEKVAGWEVREIAWGHTWLCRENVRRLLRVGESF